jgi:hypothetical protein
MRSSVVLLTFVLALTLSGCGTSGSVSRDRFAAEAVGWAVRGDAANLYANLYPAQREAIRYSVYSNCIDSRTRALKQLGVTLRVDRVRTAALRTITVPATRAVVRASAVTTTISSRLFGNRTPLPAFGQRALVGVPIYVAMVGSRWRYIDPRVATFITPGCGVPQERLGSEPLAHVPQWATAEGFKNNPRAIAGAKLFAVSGCLNCHTYYGAGGKNLGAPDLTAEGAKGKGLAFQIAHLKCPACVNAGSAMPSFAGLGSAGVRTLAVFLEASRGRK